MFFSHFSKTHLTDKARRNKTLTKYLQNKAPLPVFALVKIKHPVDVKNSLAEVSLRKRKFTFSAKAWVEENKSWMLLVESRQRCLPVLRCGGLYFGRMYSYNYKAFFYKCCHSGWWRYWVTSTKGTDCATGAPILLSFGPVQIAKSIFNNYSWLKKPPCYAYLKGFLSSRPLKSPRKRSILKEGDNVE